MTIKLQLGSGYKKINGFVNIDNDDLVNPDYNIDLDDVNIKLPFPDNSVNEIIAHHILEHIGDGFIPLMIELYRVAENGCIFDIIAPHIQHEVYYGDPTHKRPITVNGMSLFSKKYCREHIAKYSSSSGLGLRYNIDWDLESFEFDYDQFYDGMLKDFFRRKQLNQVTPEEDFGVQRLLREAWNVAMNVKIKMVAKK